MASPALAEGKAMPRCVNKRLTKGDGAPDWIRTSGPQIRNLMLYPAELRARRQG